VALARHRSLMGGAQAGARSGTLVDLLSAFTGGGGADAGDWQAHQRLAAYGVLFPQWELRLPAEWQQGWLGRRGRRREPALGSLSLPVAKTSGGSTEGPGERARVPRRGLTSSVL